MKALKLGKYSSTSSIVLSFLVRLYNFFGNGIHSFASGSSIDISLQRYYSGQDRIEILKACM